MPITIKIAKTGPFIITGEDQAQVQLVDHEGNPVAIPQGKPNLKLCRCGASVTKPFCDGTHSRIGFLAAETAVNDEQAGRTPSA